MLKDSDTLPFSGPSPIVLGQFAQGSLAFPILFRSSTTTTVYSFVLFSCQSFFRRQLIFRRFISFPLPKLSPSAIYLFPSILLYFPAARGALSLTPSDYVVERISRLLHQATHECLLRTDVQALELLYCTAINRWRRGSNSKG